MPPHVKPMSCRVHNSDVYASPVAGKKPILGGHHHKSSRQQALLRP